MESSFLGILEEAEGLQLKALPRARLFYKKCLESDKKWETRGGPIQFVIEKIQRFGSFPMTEGSSSYGDDFDLTDLLTYFNQNRTVTKELVPSIRLDKWNRSSARLQTLLICEETGRNCNSSNVRKDVEEVFSLMQRIYTAMPSSFKAKFISTHDSNKSIFHHRLSELDAISTSVNWTKYLLKLAPDSHRFYIVSDPVIIAEIESFQEIDQILLTTRKEVIVNYVMLFYVLSWVEFMDGKYRDVFETVRETLREMMEMIREEFIEVVRKNSWMDMEEKKKLVSKAKRMRFHGGYEDIHINEEELNAFHSDFLREEAFENLPFLVLEEMLEANDKMAKFKYLNDSVDVKEMYLESMAKEHEFAFYSPDLNMICMLI
ncbi:hypothetical protein Aduo_006856 [Ancylostoma duodenale]